ncbi:helix-turn-helix transcriptional regulator [Rhizobium sp. Rhizsp82]|uniref:helix-turn-helix transcriptional regulator n=1 Tax=Rhizobium sp. Rhizsp82 TaxID=3243057 RepID=UPI0039B5DABE
MGEDALSVFQRLLAAFASDKPSAMLVTKTVVFALRRELNAVISQIGGFRILFDEVFASDPTAGPNPLFDKLRPWLTDRHALFYSKDGNVSSIHRYALLPTVAQDVNELLVDWVTKRSFDLSDTSGLSSTSIISERMRVFASIGFRRAHTGRRLIALFDVRFVAPVTSEAAQDDVDRAILGNLAWGYSLNEIGGIVRLSGRTVEHRLERMKARVGCQTTAELLSGFIVSQVSD